MSVFKLTSRPLLLAGICRRHARLFFSTHAEKAGGQNDSGPSSTHNDIHDVIITGGGMVGAAMAVALGK